MKIHEYNEMMRHLTRREPSDKHLAAMPLYEQGGRVGYQSGQLVQPGPGRQGYQGPTTKTKRITNRQAKEIIKTLPDGVRLNKHPSGWRLTAQISKGDIMQFSKSYINPDADTIKNLLKTHEKEYLKVYPNSLTDAKFEELRLSGKKSKKFKKKYRDLTANQFADELNDLGYNSLRGQEFTKKHVERVQFKLDIGSEVGEKIKPLTKTQQNTLVNAFPEYAGQWDFKANKYGLNFSEVGRDTWSLLRHTADDTKRWPLGETAKSKLWHNAYRSAIKSGDGRFKILHPKDGEIMTRDEILKYNWTKGSRDVTFLDTQTKNKFNFNNFENWMNEHAVPGQADANRFKNAENKYKLTKKLKQTNVGNETLGSLLNKKYKTAKNVRFSGLVNHHIYDIADNFWDTDIVFFDDNKGVAKFEKSVRAELKAAANLPEAEQAKVLKNLTKKFKNLGPIRMVEGEMTIGSYDQKKMLTNVGDKLESKKVKAVLKNLDIPYNPGLSFMGAAGFDDLLKTVPAAKVGKFIKGIGLEFEPLFEGGFYEYFRRKGYTHDQARDETFFYKLANPDRTGILEGADPLLERDLYQIKDEEGKITGERKTVKRYVDALKERDRINKILRKKEGASDADTYAATTAEAQDLARSGAYNRVKKILQPGSAESVAYNAAVEKQQMEQGVRGIEYGEYGQGDTERLAARREKERYRLMNKKFPSYTGPQIDQRLEDYGYYINPDNRYRSKGRSLYNPQGLKLIKGVGYNAISDYFKDQDKTAYFAENFREEKAGGGRVPLSKAGSVDKARRKFLKWLAGITGATIAGGTGLIKLGSKTATKVAPQVTEEVIKRSADGMPTYIADLIQVIKAKGVKKIMDSDINKFPDTVHTYKGVDVTEDAAGNIKIKHEHPYYSQQDHIQIEKGQMNVKDEGLETQKSIQEPDEYIEGTVRPDRDGKFKDFEEGLDKDTHEFFKNIADEVFIKKAEGGLASYDNYLPGIDDID